MSRARKGVIRLEQVALHWSVVLESTLRLMPPDTISGVLEALKAFITHADLDQLYSDLRAAGIDIKSPQLDLLFDAIDELHTELHKRGRATAKQAIATVAKNLRLSR